MNVTPIAPGLDTPATPYAERPFTTLDRLLPMLEAYYLEYFNRPEQVDVPGYYELIKLLERTLRACEEWLPEDLGQILGAILRRNVLALGLAPDYVVSESALGLTVLPAA